MWGQVTQNTQNIGYKGLLAEILKEKAKKATKFFLENPAPVVNLYYF